MITPIHYTYNIYTLPLIHQWRLMICIAIDNSSNNTVAGSFYSAGTSTSEQVYHKSCHRITSIPNDVLDVVSNELKYPKMCAGQFGEFTSS